MRFSLWIPQPQDISEWDISKWNSAAGFLNETKYGLNGRGPRAKRDPPHTV